MRLSIPVYFESHPKLALVKVSLLFQIPGFDLEAESPLVEKATSRMRDRLVHLVEKLKAAERQDQLKRLAFCPEFSQHTLSLDFVYRKKSCSLRILVAQALISGHRLVYLPRLQRWFDLATDDKLEIRAVRILLEYLSELDNPDPAIVDHLSLGPKDKAWIKILDFELPASGAAPLPKEINMRALLEAAPELSGHAELVQVGHRLDDDLTNLHLRTLGRETQLEQLLNIVLPSHWTQAPVNKKGKSARLLDKSPETKGWPIALIGPRLVGKTSLTYALIAATQARQQDRNLPKLPKLGGFWLISPGRLIAGMSYVGQWESRWVKILEHARRYRHVIVIQDLLGMLSAGVSRDSTLNAAVVLKPYLEKRQVQVIVEMSQEAWHILRLRDRALADLFQVVRIEPSDRAMTQKISLAAAQQAEKLHGTKITLEALRTVYDLGQRYLTETAFPGKSAQMILQMGTRYKKQEVSRAQVLEHFQRHCGLSLQILDDRQLLDASEINTALSQRVIGQPEAVQACVNAISIAKARLWEPVRPIASFLFIGPTGVGKTECAKALAAYLFGDSDRLIRFDLNEFVGEDAVARLEGSFARPEGLLTGAVRRQPFSVILFDEIEKAHPAVLQLLLQILGDGRLTDGRGRVADFSQTMIVMTSNLGSQEAAREIGLRKSSPKQRATVFYRAAETFLSPELFNRIDQIVPFRSLETAQLRSMAELILRNVLEREGLRRRNCLLNVDELVLDRMVEERSLAQKNLGGRALKRAFEDLVTAPVARQLTEMEANQLTVLSISRQGEVDISAISSATVTSSPQLTELSFPIPELIQRLRQRLLDREQSRQGQQVSSDDLLEGEQLEYFERQESIRLLRVEASRLDARRSQTKPRSDLPAIEALLWDVGSTTAHNLLKQRDLSLAWQLLYETIPPEKELTLKTAALQLLNQEALAFLGQADRQERLTICFEGEDSLVKRLREQLRQALGVLELEPSAEKKNSDKRRLSVQGPHVERLLLGECGLHLFAAPGSLRMVRVFVDSLDCPSTIVRLHSGESSLDLATGLMDLKSKGLGQVILARSDQVQAAEGVTS
jgi:ATP-dependent Clp protease ATP-binding subunit ClpC